MTLLHEITCNINFCDLDTAIRKNPADINRLDRQGRTPLSYAIAFSNITAIRTLLENGADPNLSTENPIYEALLYGGTGLLGILELLFHFGATIQGCVYVSFAGSWIRKTHGIGDFVAIDKVLIEHGLDINHQIEGRSLIMDLCCYSMNEKVSIDRIEQLISYGADIELKDSGGYTALHLAIAFESIGILKALLRARACLDSKTNTGETVIHLIVLYSRSSEFVEAISGIDLTKLDLTSRNEDGHTAYDLLRKRNGLKWEDYLEQWQSRKQNSIPFLGRFYLPLEEYQIILNLETLLHQIQTAQGIPKDQQYPPLGDYLTDDKDEEPVPGAWPV